MLVIVENRNRHPLVQILFDVKTIRRLDIFQVDSAESGLKAFDGFGKFMRILLIDFYIKNVDTREAFE